MKLNNIDINKLNNETNNSGLNLSQEELKKDNKNYSKSKQY